MQHVANANSGSESVATALDWHARPLACSDAPTFACSDACSNPGPDAGSESVPHACPFACSDALALDRSHERSDDTVTDAC